MLVLRSILNEAVNQGTPFILLALLITVPLLRRAPGATDLRARLRFVLLLVGFHCVLLPATGVATALSAGIAKDLRVLGSVAGAIAGAGLAGLLVFGALAPRVHLALPRIVQDVLIAAIGIFAVFGTASRAGVDLTGIVATGAVVTAVIGLALQDTLGNVVGGLALQLDSTVRVGDWIRVADVTGRVVEIRWRSTSIETTGWEITKGRVSVRAKQGTQDKEVAQLGPGECFGEMSLLTGEPRSATVVALSEVECYRLHADAFRKLLERRGDLAAKMAAQLAERRVGLVSSREQLADHKALVANAEQDLLDKIRAFFRLE